MNKLTRDIAEWLKVDAGTAKRVHMNMALLCGSRFGQDSTAKLKRDAARTLALLSD